MPSFNVIHQPAYAPYPVPRTPRTFTRMKSLPLVFGLILCASLCQFSQLGHAQESPAPSQEDYAYLTRMHVPEPVIRCVAAFDRWVALTPKYDTFIVPDRRVLRAKIDSDTSIFSAGNPIPVDEVIAMRAFAKVRGRSQWTRVDSRCGVRDGRVVGVSLTPNVRPKIVR
jgi:hypothetical protein